MQTILANVRIKNKKNPSDFVNEDRVFSREEKVFSKDANHKSRIKTMQRASTVATEKIENLHHKSDIVKVN